MRRSAGRGKTRSLRHAVIAAAAVVLGATAQSQAAPIESTFNALDPQIMGGFLFSSADPETVSFEITNNSGVSWTGFEVTSDFANYVPGTFAGPGIGVVANESLPIENASLVISGIDIGQGAILSFDLDVAFTGTFGGVVGFLGDPGADAVVDQIPLPAGGLLLLTGLGALLVGQRRRS